MSEDRIQLDPGYVGQSVDSADREMPLYGSRFFYRLLSRARDLHSRKSHDYASNDNPAGNYHFAGQLASLFRHSPDDMGFVGRIGEKLYRLANIESSGKKPLNESIEDTELDIVTITTLWMASRQEKRSQGNPLEKELFDLIMHMPDDQAQRIVHFIYDLKKSREANRVNAGAEQGLSPEYQSPATTRGPERERRGL